MIRKLRIALANWIWPTTIKTVCVRQDIPADLIHSFDEYEKMARSELQGLMGDTTTLRPPRIEYKWRMFTVYWECNLLSERWKINPYLSKDYEDRVLSAVKTFPGGLSVTDKM